jgi:hypothetical protein
MAVPEIALWHWYSSDQAVAAATFVRKCGALEADKPEPSEAEAQRGLVVAEWAVAEHRSFVVAAILASVAFLEAAVNELFASASHDNLEVAGGRGGLAATERKILTDLNETLANNRTLDRYQLVLHLLGRQPFDRGTAFFQDLDLLIRFRNSLVHYKPEWRPAGIEGGPTSADSKLARGLATKHFSHNPFTGPGNPFFPDKCLGHGCAVWAWTAALAFADEFFRRLGVTPIYHGIRAQLSV